MKNYGSKGKLKKTEDKDKKEEEKNEFVMNFTHKLKA